MKVTKEEQDLIFANRKLEDEDKPTKEGFLKFDLYTAPRDNYEVSDQVIWHGPMIPPDPLVSKTVRDSVIEAFKDHCYLALEKGCRFIYFINDGWYDCGNYGLEGMGDEWAEDHLENIKKL